MTYRQWICALSVCVLSICVLGSCVSTGTKESAEAKRIHPPKLTTPKYRTIWVPDKIDGDRYEEGHRVHIIEEAGRWISQ